MASILVVDDEIKIRSLLKTILESEGHKVDEAPEGATALRLCRANRYDLIITDLIMPEMEGLETIMLLRREMPDLKIVAISGGGQRGNLDFLSTAEKLGAARTIAKPFSGRDVLGVVRELLA